MKTKDDFKELNINDYAFFKGISVTDAKWVFADIIFPEGWHNLKPDAPFFGKSNKYVNDKGVPKISTSEMVGYDKFDFSMNSNSELDKKCQLTYLCNFYNNGIPLQKLREHSQNKTYIKALKFTGKNQVINAIINPNQLLKIQKTWLLSNVYMIKNWSKNCIEFIEHNDWAIGFLKVNMIPEDEYLTQKSRVNQKLESA